MTLHDRNKGKRGELEAAKFLREQLGLSGARRGRQFHGAPGSPDIADAVDGWHTEVKRCEQLSLYKAMEQALAESGEGEVPVVMHRRNGKRWLLVMDAKDFEDAAVSFLRAKGWDTSPPGGQSYDVTDLYEEPDHADTHPD